MKKLIGMLVVILLLGFVGKGEAKDVSVDSALSAGLIKVGNLKMDEDINDGELDIVLNSGLGIGVKGTIYYISKEKPNLLDFDIGVYSYLEGVNADRVDLSVSLNLGFLQKGKTCLVNIGYGVRLSGSGDLNARQFLLFSIGGYELMPEKVIDE